MSESGMSLNITINLDQLPVCKECSDGVMLPLQDVTNYKEGSGGISGIPYMKGWACSQCSYNIIFRGGNLGIQPINDDRIVGHDGVKR